MIFIKPSIEDDSGLRSFTRSINNLNGVVSQALKQYWQDYQKEHDGRSTPIDLLYNMSSVIGDEYQNLTYVLSAIKNTKIIDLETQSIENELEITKLKTEAAQKDVFITELENCAVESELKAATLEVEAAY